METALQLGRWLGIEAFPPGSITDPDSTTCKPAPSVTSLQAFWIVTPAKVILTLVNLATERIPDIGMRQPCKVYNILGSALTI